MSLYSTLSTISASLRAYGVLDNTALIIMAVAAIVLVLTYMKLQAKADSLYSSYTYTGQSRVSYRWVATASVIVKVVAVALIVFMFEVIVLREYM